MLGGEWGEGRWQGNRESTFGARRDLVSILVHSQSIPEANEKNGGGGFGGTQQRLSDR